MRKLLRQKAHHQMEKAGLTGVNKRPWVVNPVSGIRSRADSKFKRLWQEYATKPVKKVSA